VTSRTAFAWVVLGAAAWLALLALGVAMYVGRTPPAAGFDLELLLLGGRRVASGLTPYDPALIAGAQVQIESLFYSYPPVVAQVMSVVAVVPSPVLLVAWAAGAVTAAVAVAAVIERRLANRPSARFGLPIAAVLPLWFPFAVALLFGNLDAWFAALFGLMLVGALAAATPADTRRAPARDLALAGVALAVASVAKLHPASIGLWFLVRGARERRDGKGIASPSWRILGVAALAGVVILAASLAVSGIGPWTDYLAILRAGTSADLLDARNLGPSVQVALALGLGGDAVRAFQVMVTIAAVLATIVAAWRVADPVESLAWASVASFVVLPVTWFHYPAALVPFAVAAVVRAVEAGQAVRRRTLALVTVALTLGIAGIGSPLIWLSVGVLLLAVRASRPLRTPAGATAPGAAAVGA
jgi:glycosyl transferase family 87